MGLLLGSDKAVMKLSARLPSFMELRVLCPSWYGCCENSVNPYKLLEYSLSDKKYLVHVSYSHSQRSSRFGGKPFILWVHVFSLDFQVPVWLDTVFRDLTWVGLLWMSLLDSALHDPSFPIGQNSS